MPKFCNNGHQMEDSWTDCPYCVKPGYRVASPALGKTVPDMGATVPDLGATRPDGNAGGSDPRKTVPMMSLKRSPVVGWLVAMNGSQKGEDFRLREGKNTLGSAASAEVEIKLSDPAVSGKHASISYRDGKFVLTDLDSTNGTFVNESAEPVARVGLSDNDVIRLGETTLKFKCL
jgi:Inner membrane component of T3SS, cytoplasmic domain